MTTTRPDPAAHGAGPAEPVRSLRDVAHRARPVWLDPVVARGAEVEPLIFRGQSPVARAAVRAFQASGRAREAAVLVLLGGSPDATSLPDDANVVLTQRSLALRNHGGQVSFPGGRRDPGDDFPLGTAAREAWEETGVDPAGITPVTVLDPLPMSPSGYTVTPVIGYWAEPSPIGVVDPGETARVEAVPLAELIAPENRFRVKKTLPGGIVAYIGPAFAVHGMFVWGFTGGILSALIDVCGWEREWDVDDVRELSVVERGVGT